MTTFHITDPTGAIYEVDAPEGATEKDALTYVQKNHDKLKALAPEKPGMSKLKAQMKEPVSPETGLGARQTMKDSEARKLNDPNINVAGELSYGAGQPFVKSAQVLARVLPQSALDAIGKVGEAFGGKPGQITAASTDEAVRQRAANMKAENVSETSPGFIASNMAVTAPLAAMGGPAWAAPMISGGAAGALEPVTGNDLGFETALQTGLGAAGGKAAELGLRAVGAVARPVVNKAKNLLNEFLGIAPTEGASDPIRQQAAAKIISRFEQDQAGGGPTATEAIERMDKARAAGIPLTLADIGGENVNALAGNISRIPGEARNITKSFLDQRDAGANGRLTAGIEKHLATGSMRETAQALIKSRSQEARPLWDKAMAGGSIAPLQRQFENEFSAATQAEDAANKVLAQARTAKTFADAKTATTGDNVYAANSSAGEQMAATQRMEAAQKQLQEARAAKAKTMEGLTAAQQDGSLNKPGAVWNPRIQALLDNPEVKRGLSAGLREQRNLADAEGRKFDPTEYAITGTDEKGEPIVGKVPNMRLLAAAKEGLNSIIESPEARDPNTGNLTKYGRSVDQLRTSLLEQLDQINPDYKVARAQWAGRSASMDALRWGRNLFKDRSEQGALFSHNPEEVDEQFKALSDSDKEFARLGVADSLRERIMKTGIGGDEAKSVIKSPWMRAKLRPLFKSDDEFSKFADVVVGEERNMFETRRKILGGSDTARRQAEDQSGDVNAALDAARGVGHAATHNWLGVASSAARLKQFMDQRANPDVNAEISRLLFDPNINLSRSPGSRLLEDFKGPQTQNFLRKLAPYLAPAGGALAGSIAGP